MNYNVPLPAAAATLTEGLSLAFQRHATGETGWIILIGTIYDR